MYINAFCCVYRKYLYIKKKNFLLLRKNKMEYGAGKCLYIRFRIKIHFSVEHCVSLHIKLIEKPLSYWYFRYQTAFIHSCDI